MMTMLGRNGGHLSPSGPYHFSSISTAHSLSDAIAAVNIEDRATNWILDLCTQENWDKEVALTRNGTVSFLSLVFGVGQDTNRWM